MLHKVFIAIPAHSGQVMVPTICSIIGSFYEANEAGWQLPEVHVRSGDADLIRARNCLVAEFLKSECTDLLLVDSDISWGPQAFTRLVSHDVDFVAAAYRMRTDKLEYYPVIWPEQKRMWTDPKTGHPLVLADGVAVGFCRIRRPCVERMVESLNGHHIIDISDPDMKIPWLFDFERRDGVRLEEGYSLCRRWRDLGGEIWVDPAINLGHTGLKTFKGDLGAVMQKEIHDAFDLQLREARAS